MTATIGCRRCGDPVTIAAAARTGGFCAACAKSQRQAWIFGRAQYLDGNSNPSPDAILQATLDYDAMAVAS